MPSYSIQESALIPAPADTVYRILADYRDGHQRILPSSFRGLAVEQGGFGAGTVIRFEIRTMGRTRKLRAAISEPVPGRVLVETDLDFNRAVTTFTVDPAEKPGWTRAGISTRLEAPGGVLGSMERAMTSWYLRRLYAQELQILSTVATAK